MFGRADQPPMSQASSYTPSDLTGQDAEWFQAQQTFAAGTNPYAVTMGDVNGDGTFQAQQTFAVGATPNGVTLGDVNGDGKPDLVIANYGTNSVSVLLGNAIGMVAGTLANEPSIAATYCLVAK